MNVNNVVPGFAIVSCRATAVVPQSVNPKSTVALTIGERPSHAELAGAVFVAAGAVLMSVP